MNLLKKVDTFDSISLEPLREMAAYEALWKTGVPSFKKIAALFTNNPGVKPSDLVDERDIRSLSEYLLGIFSKEKDLDKINILINTTFDYPAKLRDAEYPVEILYYKGNLDLINTPSVAIVGTRNPTMDGVKRAKQLSKYLVEDGVTIVSGLAKGIDTAAHTAAIENNGRTIAVIGTPLNEVYPKENKDLQNLIAENHLLISQIPFWRYSQQTYRANRLFFPERNKTMSALTEATIIVEAGETSGTLIQAQAAIYQKRKLYILESCFQNPNITWPEKYEKLGAIRVKTYEDIRRTLKGDIKVNV
jgi:DNA processing protein